MKWYSHRSYKQHLEDLKSFKDSNEVREAFMKWPQTISNRFDRAYPRVGILDLTDLLQEGYVGFYKAWEKLNWELIYSRVEPERIGMITNYVKASVKRHIIRAIARDRDTIRIPENYYSLKPMGENNWKGQKYNENMQTDIFLTRTFSSFFDESVLDQMDSSSDYISDLLNDMLNEIMDIFLTKTEKIIVKMFYGIDEPYDHKKSVIRIAEYCSMTDSNVKVTKHRAIKKLQQETTIELIENKYLEIVT